MIVCAMIRHQIGVAVFALGVLAPWVASAQYINSSPASQGVQYRPQGAFNEQPLATNRQDFSVYVGPLANPKFGTNEEVGIHAVRTPDIGFGSELAWFFQAGAAYGITRGFEAGIFTPPLLMGVMSRLSQLGLPTTGTGDLPLFVTWATSVEDIDIGIRNTLTIPLRESSFWRWNPGLHTLVRFDRGRLDLGAFFPMVFVEDQVVANLEIPVRAYFGFDNDIFLGLETGVRKIDLTNEDGTWFLPLGAALLYSLEAGEHRIDFAGRFAWQSFVWLNAPEGWPDRVLEDAYTISVGANMIFDVDKFAGEKKTKKKSTPPSVDSPDEVQGKPGAQP